MAASARRGLVPAPRARAPRGAGPCPHVDERRRDRSVLGLGLAQEDVRRGPRPGCTSAMSSPSISPTIGARPRSTSGGAPEQRMPSFCAPMQAGSEQRGQPRADADLAGVGDGLHRQGLGHGRPGDEQLAMDAAGHEEVERPGPDPDRHPQDDRAAAQVEPADPVDRALHLPGGPARAAHGRGRRT